VVDIKSKAIPVSPVLHGSGNVERIRNAAPFDPRFVKRVFVASSVGLREDSDHLEDRNRDTARSVPQEEAHGK
jgi:hypothetical protein